MHDLIGTLCIGAAGFALWHSMRAHAALRQAALHARRMLEEMKLQRCECDPPRATDPCEISGCGCTGVCRGCDGHTL
jgi:hypothetical protein